MLYIKVGDSVASWHVRDMFPFTAKQIECLPVKFIQADGHELIKIHHLVSNIPKGSGNVTKWFGDTAAFIANELQMDSERIKLIGEIR